MPVAFPIALAMLAAALQPASPAQAREAYGACLDRHVRTSLEASLTVEAFAASLETACAAERARYRNAMLADGYSEADAEEELAWSRENVGDSYRGFIETNTRPAD
ncbi:MAG: hypothetical protein ACFBQW_01460 [Sphingomonadaceae bacterium]